MKSFTFTNPTTGFVVTLTVTDNGDGTLSLLVDVDESTGTTGDVRAIYFNNTEDQLHSGLDVTTAEVDGDTSTTSDTGDVALRQDANKVRYVESRDTNVNGEVINENDGAFDTGIEFGSQGMASDDVQHMELTLSSDDGLTLDSFDWSMIGMRVTSVGDVDGSRDGSLKLTGEADPEPAPSGETDPEPPQLSTVDAENDFGFGDFDLVSAGNTVLVEGLDGSSLSWLDNDMDPEGDSFQLVLVSGANGTSSDVADAEGWFDWVDADNGGQIRLNADGRVEIGDPNETLPGPYLMTSVNYTIEDETGATDTALVLVELMAAD